MIDILFVGKPVCRLRNYLKPGRRKSYHCVQCGLLSKTNSCPFAPAVETPHSPDCSGCKPPGVQKEAHATKQSLSSTGAPRTETATEGERLHKMYDGNGRPRENGGFCS